MEGMLENRNKKRDKEWRGEKNTDLVQKTGMTRKLEKSITKRKVRDEKIGETDREKEERREGGVSPG